MFTKGDLIEVRLKLKGGSENESNKAEINGEESISIICINANGYPTNKNNWQKTMEVRKLMQK